jgi:hypothetical protein
MAQRYTDEELELIRQALERGAVPLDPYSYRGPDTLAEIGRVLEGAGRSVEEGLQGENPMERFAELIPRVLGINPLKGVGSALQLRAPEVREAVSGVTRAAKEAYEDPGAVARAIGSKVTEQDFPMQLAEGVSISDFISPMSGIGAVLGMAAAVPKAVKKLPKWKKISPDDYDTVDGEWSIARLAAEDNSYANVDEWTVYNRKTGDAHDVYTKLKDAKAAVVDMMAKE